MMKAGPKKKNIVIFTIYFPPVISIASYRLEAFAKYLDKGKFNITVICPEIDSEDAYSEINSVNVIRLANKPHFLKVKFRNNDSFFLHKFKALYNRIFNLFVHDEYRTWKRKAITEFKKLNSIEDVDYVVSTYPVVAPHLAALELKKQGFGFKWIADMRDEMSQNPFSNYFKRRYLEKIERKLFSEANCITTVTPGCVASFKDLVQNKIIIEEIRNGYDFEITDDYNYNDVFTITHTGTFYADIKPFSFLKVISLMLSENILPKMKIVFVGAGNSISIPEELKGIVSTTQRIPHVFAEQKIKESDANLLILPKSSSIAIPGKLYEYIAAQKPVLALAENDSEAAKLINVCNAGYIAGFNNTDEIKQNILKAHELWKGRKRLKVKVGYIKQYHRKVQVKKLEKLILEKL